MVKRRRTCNGSESVSRSDQITKRDKSQHRRKNLLASVKKSITAFVIRRDFPLDQSRMKNGLKQYQKTARLFLSSTSIPCFTEHYWQLTLKFDQPLSYQTFNPRSFLTYIVFFIIDYSAMSCLSKIYGKLFKDAQTCRKTADVT